MSEIGLTRSRYQRPLTPRVQHERGAFPRRPIDGGERRGAAGEIEDRVIDGPGRQDAGALDIGPQRPDAGRHADRPDPEGEARQEIRPRPQPVRIFEPHLLQRHVEALEEAAHPALTLRDAALDGGGDFLDQRVLDDAELAAVVPEAHADFRILDRHPGMESAKLDEVGRFVEQAFAEHPIGMLTVGRRCVYFMPSHAMWSKACQLAAMVSLRLPAMFCACSTS